LTWHRRTARNSKPPKRPFDVPIVTGKHTLTNQPPYKHTAFIKALQDAENAQKAGYELDAGWFPHGSPEGGTRTIGYGHKLTPSEDAREYVLIGGLEYAFDFLGRKGVPDDKINELFREDIERSMNTARAQWNSFYSTSSHFDNLASKYQCILTDIVFNVGTLVNRNEWQWPKLAAAILTNTDSEVRGESLRYFTNPMGKKIPLTERRDMICNAVGIEKE